MIRHVPRYILHQLAAQKLKGSFDAYVLLLDIVDFTGISESLHNEGRQGAESIGVILNTFTKTPLDIVRKHGGFVSLFIGDALCAIFPEGNPNSVLCAMHEIKEFVSALSAAKETGNKAKINLRNVMCYGQIHWQIFVSEYQYEYIFHGKPLYEASALSAENRESSISETVVQKLGAQHFSKQGKEWVLGAAPLSICHHGSYPKHTSDALQWQFCSSRFHQIQPVNEIRNVVPCFIKLGDPSALDMQVKKIHALAEQYRGYVNKLESSDQGVIVLVLFAVPYSEGKSVQQACEFALDLLQEIPASAIGLSCGFAYTGYIGDEVDFEYTALGHTMNIASRLMNRAKQSEVLCDNSIWCEIQHRYHLNYLGSIHLKGVKAAIRYFNLNRFANTSALHFRHRFVGRHSEKLLLNNRIGSVIKGEPNQILYIHGEPGLGKSRLAWEVMHKSKDFHGFLMQCQYQSAKALEPIRQILRQYFQIVNDAEPIAVKQHFLKATKSSVFGNKTKSLDVAALGCLIGINTEDRAWAQSSSERKAQLQKEAFGRFMAGLIREKPIVILLDDAGWLDSESISYLNAISEYTAQGVMILATCRYQLDGSLVNLNLSGFGSSDLELGKLSGSESEELLMGILRVDSIPKGTLQLIRERAGSNPFYLEQIALYLVETQTIDEHANLLGDISRINAFSLSDVINSRVDAFTENMKECLYNASVLGMQFNIKVLSAMLKEDIQSSLDAGKQHRLWTDISEIHYIFSHIMLRDVIYERMLQGKVQKLHRLAAITLENMNQGNLHPVAEDIAYHYEKAECMPEAIQYYRVAAEYHAEHSSWAVGVSFQRKAVIKSGRCFGFGSPEHIEYLFWLAIYYHRVQLFTKAEPMYLQVLKMRTLHLGGENPELSPYLNNTGRFYKDIARYDLAEPLLRQSLKIEARYPESTNTADRLNNLASMYTKMGKHHKALAYSKRALAIFELCHRDDKLFFISLMQGNIGALYLFLGEIDKAEAMMLIALQGMQTICAPNNPRIASSHVLLHRLYMVKNRIDLAEPEIRKAMAIQKAYYGMNNPEYARSLMYLGDIFAATKRKSYARKLWRIALKTIQGCVDCHHPYLLDLQDRFDSA